MAERKTKSTAGGMPKKSGVKSTAKSAVAPASSQSPSRLIDRRIKELADWRGETLARMRKLILEADSEIIEEWKWRGVPVWSRDGIVCTGESYKTVVKLTFHKGAQLDDPSELFNSSLEGNARRAIDISEGEKVDAKAFKILVKAAVALNASKVKKPTTVTKPTPIKQSTPIKKTKTVKKPIAVKTPTVVKTSTAVKKATPEKKAAPDKSTSQKSTSQKTTSPKTTSQPPAPKSGAEKPVKLLTGGNPQIAKADGDAPVQDYIAAMPGWKSEVGKRLDELIVETIPNVRKVVKWNTPLYGIGDDGYFVAFHVLSKCVNVTFFRGTSLKPVPPVDSKNPETRYFKVYEEDDLDEKQLVKWLKQAAALPGWTP